MYCKILSDKLSKQLSVIVEAQKSVENVSSLAVLCAANGYVLTPLVNCQDFPN